MMREITRRDLIALTAPAIMILVVAATLADERGWALALIVAGSMGTLIATLWWRRIQKHSKDTWTFRL
jgi:alpha-beta hydrolase superfamily lysophospholipase